MNTAQSEKTSVGTLRHVFGPVRSGRLGLSLGLDLLGARICSFDCLYCEVGRTEARVAARKPYVRAETILDELASFCAGPHPDFEVITLGGLGEPSLNTEMGLILEGIRRIAPGTPTAVLTNSAHLSDPRVRAEMALADMVLPSMDSLVEEEFQRLNQPHPGLSLEAIRRGLLAFRREYAGKIFLETLLVRGVNDGEENLARLRDFCRELAPERVDVVTITRPGAWPGVRAAAQDVLARFRRELGAAVGPPRSTGHGPSAFSTAAAASQGIEDAVRASLGRRPQTAGQLAEALMRDPAAIARALERLLETGRIAARDELGQTFYAGVTPERH